MNHVTMVHTNLHFFTRAHSVRFATVMSESRKSSVQTQTSYVAAMSNDIPKYVLRVELLKCVESETEVQVVANSKAQYLVYDESDNILYKTTQLLWQIGAELGVRNEKSCHIDITR